MRRLNRIEYNNTVRDLLHTSQSPADGFPPDAVANGFDNNADQMTLDDTTLRLLESAAEDLAAEAANPNSPTLSYIAPCTPAADANMCLQHFVEDFGARAWRRPLSAAESTTMLALAQSGAGETYAQRVERGVMGFLISPAFLFRVEADPAGDANAVHALGSYELATRLSYFVWSTMPDDALFAAAADGSLTTDVGLSTQLARMLADPKAAALSHNFAGQWLGLRYTAEFVADPATFHAWQPALRDMMVEQSQLTFNDLLQGGQGLITLFTADTTYLNDSLAAFYGLPAPGTSALTKVTVPAGPRRGLLGQGAILMSTSFPVRTSIVRRGKYVQEQFLCAPIPPPPPAVPTLLPSGSGGSQRQRLEAHATTAVCAGCHSQMDPYGFVLEQFDAIGALRTLDNGVPIDTTAKLPNGQMVSDMQTLQQTLAADARFPNCFVKQLGTYALGRTLQTSDAATLTAWQKDFSANQQRVDQLLRTIVMSPAFRTRKGGN